MRTIEVASSAKTVQCTWVGKVMNVMQDSFTEGKGN